MRIPHSLQNSHNLQHLSVKSTKGRNHLQILNETSLAERYVKGNLSVVLELGLKPNDSFVGLKSSESNIEPIDTPIFVLYFHAANTSDCDHGEKQKMFIVDVESVKGADVDVPSLVRLYCIKKFNESGGYFRSLDGRFKFLPINFGVDGELAVVGRIGNGGAPSDIQSGMEVVDYIASNQCEIGTQVAIGQTVIQELFPRIALHVQAGAITIRRGAESLLEIRDVLFGPFDL